MNDPLPIERFSFTSRKGPLSLVLRKKYAVCDRNANGLDMSILQRPKIFSRYEVLVMIIHKLIQLVLSEIVTSSQ